MEALVVTAPGSFVFKNPPGYIFLYPHSLFGAKLMAAKTTDALAVINDYLVVLTLMNGFRRTDLNTLSAYDTPVVYYFRLGPEYLLYEAQDLSPNPLVARIPKSRHIKVFTPYG